MQRKTPTTYGQLRLGDRFYFTSDKHKKAYQITREKDTIADKTSYNIVQEDGRKIWPSDRQAKNDAPVVFLRHTIPMPGDECMLYDLTIGDTFFFPSSVIQEYIIVKTDGYNEKEKYLVDTLNAETPKLFWQANTEVIYIRRKTFVLDEERLANVPFNH